MRLTTVTVRDSGARLVSLSAGTTSVLVGESFSDYSDIYTDFYTLRRIAPQHEANVETGDTITIVTKTPNRVAVLPSTREVRVL